MEYQVKSGSLKALSSSCLVVGVFNRRQLSSQAEEINQASHGQLLKLLRKSDLQGENGQTLQLLELPEIKAKRVLLLGLGDKKSVTSKSMAADLTEAVKLLNTGTPLDALLALPFDINDCSPYATARNIVLESEQALYRFDQCKNNAEAPKRPLKKLTLWAASRNQSSRLSKGIDHGSAMAQGVALAKDLSNLPGNICTPTYLAEQARKLGHKSTKLKVTVLEEKSMEKLGMGALLSVSRGSRQPAKFIVMEYKGGKADSKPIALVGKGLTFDAGGISIKPAANMDEMKYDMCGGASVLGTMAACVALNLPINCVGIVPSSENLPDGAANKPGDIVTSMSGQTIEILNTDAEGRLILCDALTYTERFKPAAVIDIATLTGACVVALGHHASGLLANDDKLADEILAAGDQAGDRAWRLPLWDDYKKQLNSNFADMANIGGRSAGAITAACFLSSFTGSFKWAHLDIAGTAWITGNEKGATGRPVPLLTQYLLRKCHLSE